ncbi:hypothetical protein TWF694_000401 [Orbilia ellipsospora]|uniref:Uncharacterized protein n=1 Tax=Orbilia ellipsospora TaxID=2528407 RepID=A0AAV9XNX8_9PEZI
MWSQNALIAIFLTSYRALGTSASTSPNNKASHDPCRIENPTANTSFNCTTYPMDENGICPMDLDKVHYDCASFCEVRRQYLWGKEVRINGVDINYQEGVRRIVVKKGAVFFDSGRIGINPQLKYPYEVISDYIGHEFNRDTKLDYSLESNKPTAYPGEIAPWCGYFAFIPLIGESCGTMSRWKVADLVNDSNTTSLVACDMDARGDTWLNQCVQYPHLKANGNPSGETIVGKQHFHET